MLDGTLIVTNGDQTDTVLGFPRAGQGLAGGAVLAHLRARRTQLDAARIRAHAALRRAICSRILKAQGGNPDCCERFFYTYDAATPGVGHFISTYEGDGIPAAQLRTANRVAAQVPDLDALALTQALWDALDADNRVSLYVCVDGNRGSSSTSTAGRMKTDERAGTEIRL